ncbi:MAG TPA: phospholipase D family protein [Bacteriovoracaceae bacterium]|nr:phospholipase D family protein [Bacteriovoracaceae bacterium]
MKKLLLLLALLSTQLASAQILSDSIPYPFYVIQENSENEVMSIDSGPAALELRLQMIRRASKSIEVEYYSYNTDLASKIFTQELIQAAKRGVKVRVLIDKAKLVFVFHKYYAKLLDEHGIEVRYFNDASILHFTKAIYRNHRKLLLIDGAEALTGGRNMGDEYFEMSAGLNYSDRDIHIKGPIVTPIQDSFNIYFEHKISERPKFPESTTNKKALAAAQFLSFTADELTIKKRMEQLGVTELKKVKSHLCPVTTFSTDGPGGGIKGFYSQKHADKTRFLRKTLIDKISQIDKNLLISTPYFLENDDSGELIKHLLEKQATITISTNSLAASDAAYMSALMYLKLKKWLKRGMHFYLHTGQAIGEGEYLNSAVAAGRWSDHSKTHVYETSTYSEVMIGTFNMHNRSSYYDSEMAVFCKGNDEFTAEVKNSIMNRALKGIYIDKDKGALDPQGNPIDRHGRSSSGTMKLLTIPAWFLRFML